MAANPTKVIKERVEPDVVYRVTDKDQNQRHLGVRKGDTVGLTIGGVGPLPMRIVATHRNQGRISVVPVGGGVDLGLKDLNLVTGKG